MSAVATPTPPPAVTFKRRMLKGLPKQVRDSFSELYDLDEDRQPPPLVVPKKKPLPPGGRWLPGCTSDTESYIHPQFGWMETRQKGKG